MAELTVAEMAARVSDHLPDGFELRLYMARGKAWVAMCNADGNQVQLPASSHPLEKQINDALCIARGWGTWVSSQEVLGAKT